MLVLMTSELMFCHAYLVSTGNISYCVEYQYLFEERNEEVDGQHDV